MAARRDCPSCRQGQMLRTISGDGTCCDACGIFIAITSVAVQRDERRPSDLTAQLSVEGRRQIDSRAELAYLFPLPHHPFAGGRA
ncbi:hypothetical protein SAMN05216456_1295 [Devosia crocina]|uniref:Uncharacterized protein n=1 Tax=Devosia crocina TaxID=429728 RepID=A0A1I7N9G0_9HYPH|nr:hypothetical protein [Devosia crocina]SFV31297.1 hypothetical protein SAMN05216456_1295 [Devosia crocina]